MRVTQSEMYRTFGSDINRINEDLADVNSQISSGKKLQSLADSPGGSADLVEITAQAYRVDMHHANVDKISYRLKSAESALNEANNLLSSIQTLGMQATADTLSSDARAALAGQLRLYRDQMIALGNTQVDGQYLFAGTNVNTTPFALNGDSVFYNGNDEINTIPVDDGVDVAQGVSGGAVFNTVFTVIDGMLAGLEAGDLESAKNYGGQFSDAIKDFDKARLSVGANLSMLQNLSSVLDSKKTILTERRSTIEDADMVAATLQLGQLKSALDGALAAGGNIMKQSNLFDILG